MLNLENKFVKIIYKILRLRKKKSMNLKIDEVSNWDSLNNLQLLVFLEKEFKIKFTENELMSFTSLKKIFNILKKKLNAKNQKFK
jgi:acyl carrier protein